MENNRQKWVNLSFVIAAGLVVYLFFSLMTQVAAAYDLEARFHEIDLIIRGISIFFGLVTFIYCYRSEVVNQFMNEAIVELSRVTWPTPKDTYRATIVVIIMVMISGFFLGGLDTLWTWALKFIL